MLKTPKWLNAHGIIPLAFYGVEPMEASVVAAIHFHDPDQVSDDAKRQRAKT